MIDPAVIEERISVARFAPYIASAHGDLDLAVELYQWNTQMSAALFELLQHAEVTLRNALAEQLVVLRQAAGDPTGRWFWYETDTWFSPWWQPAMINNLRNAVNKASGGDRPVTNGRVVSELSFGFWRYLLTSHYLDSLWIPGLRHAFPKGLPRAVVNDLVDQIHHLRNRIAHHEPIYRRDLVSDVLRIEQLLHWLSPPIAEWAMQTSRVSSLWEARPTGQ